MPEYISDSEYLGTMDSSTSARLRRGFVCEHNDIKSCPILSLEWYPKKKARRRVHYVRVESD